MASALKIMDILFTSIFMAEMALKLIVKVWVGGGGGRAGQGSEGEMALKRILKEEQGSKGGMLGGLGEFRVQMAGKVPTRVAALCFIFTGGGRSVEYRGAPHLVVL